MGVLRPKTEYLLQDNTAEIQDLYDIVKSTENYRAKKVEDLQKEHALIMRKIDRLKQQKVAYIRISGVLSSDDAVENIMPVHKNDNYDTGESILYQDENTNKILLKRKPTDPVFNYTRDTLRDNISEIDIKIRNYDYDIMRLSLLEKKLTFKINNILKKETAIKQVVV